MYLLFDIGGSKMRLALSADGQTYRDPVLVSTPSDAASLLEVFRGLADSLVAGQKLAGVAGGITRKRLESVPDLQSLFDCPVAIENDTALVGLGEAVAGAGQPEGIMAYVTVSTGVGAVRLVDGRIDRSARGFEPGHQIIDWENNRSLESLVSGNAVSAERGVEPQLVTDVDYWRAKAKILAIGLHNLILHWSPELVVLGGSMFKTPGLDLEEVRAALGEIPSILGEPPTLRLAKLGDFGGLDGALALAQEKFGA